MPVLARVWYISTLHWYISTLVHYIHLIEENVVQSWFSVNKKGTLYIPLIHMAKLGFLQKGSFEFADF